MKSFSLEIPTRIRFGKGILQSSLAEIAQETDDNIMIVTGGKSAKKYGYLQLVQEALGNTKRITIFSDISPNPKTSEIDRAISIGRTEDIKCLIGLGGGSAIDAAKVIAAGIGMRKTAEDFLLKKAVPNGQVLPIIAIPTTSGTGSELSKGAIVTDEKNVVKTGIRGDSLYPQYAVVDPALTYTVPYRITMETGFDVLAHAVESYISKKAFAFSEMLSLEIIKRTAVNLKLLNQNTDNESARDEMSYCSMLMGINLGNVGTALPHRLQYPVGALTDTSHGAGLAALYPAWIDCTYQYSVEKFNNIVSLIAGCKIESKTAALSAVKDFLQEINLAYRFDDLGIEAKQLDWLTNHVTGNIENDPAAVEADIVRKIYSTAFKEEL